MKWALGIVVGLLVSWVAIHAAGGLADAAGALGQVRAPWLVPAAVVEALSYVVLGAKLRELIGRDVVGTGESVQLGLVVSGFGLLTPASPAEGLAILASHLRRRGVPRRRVAFTVGFSEWFSLLVFLLVSSVNLVIVAAIEPDPLDSSLPLLVVAAVVLVFLGLVARLLVDEGATAAVIARLGALRRHGRALTPEARRLAAADLHREARAFVGSGRQFARVALLTAAAFLGDVACLWFAMLAAGGQVGFDVALLAVSIASFSVLVPLVPGGLGLVEATIPAVAHRFGMPYDQGLAAALVYRGFGTFVPATAGVGAIVALRRRAAAGA